MKCVVLSYFEVPGDDEVPCHRALRCGACSMRCYVAAAAHVVSCSELRPKRRLNTERSGAQIQLLLLYFRLHVT